MTIEELKQCVDDCEKKVKILMEIGKQNLAQHWQSELNRFRKLLNEKKDEGTGA